MFVYVALTIYMISIITEISVREGQPKCLQMCSGRNEKRERERENWRNVITQRWVWMSHYGKANDSPIDRSVLSWINWPQQFFTNWNRLELHQKPAINFDSFSKFWCYQYSYDICVKGRRCTHYQCCTRPIIVWRWALTMIWPGIGEKWKIYHVIVLKERWANHTLLWKLAHIKIGIQTFCVAVLWEYQQKQKNKKNVHMTGHEMCGNSVHYTSFDYEMKLETKNRYATICVKVKTFNSQTTTTTKKNRNKKQKKQKFIKSQNEWEKRKHAINVGHGRTSPLAEPNSLMSILTVHLLNRCTYRTLHFNVNRSTLSEITGGGGGICAG